MSKKRLFTYRFVFKWDDGTEDETEFCASSTDEAMELFVHWCHDDMQIPYTPAVHPFVDYNADDAVEYGERYFANPCPGYVYKDLVCNKGKVYAEEFPVSGIMDNESIIQIDDFLKAVAEKHGCKQDDIKTYLEDAWSFTKDYDLATLAFGPAKCGFYIDGQAEWFN